MMMLLRRLFNNLPLQTKLQTQTITVITMKLSGVKLITREIDGEFDPDAPENPGGDPDYDPQLPQYPEDTQRRRREQPGHLMT